MTVIPKTILVVDDDDLIRSAVTAALELEGYRVEGARHGRQAIDLLRAGLCPSLILLDMMMPVMNGWEFLAERSSDLSLARFPLIVVSAALQAAPRGTTGFLKKPVSLDTLLETVGAQLQPLAG